MVAGYNSFWRIVPNADYTKLRVVYIAAATIKTLWLEFVSRKYYYSIDAHVGWKKKQEWAVWCKYVFALILMKRWLNISENVGFQARREKNASNKSVLTCKLVHLISTTNWWILRNYSWVQLNIESDRDERNQWHLCLKFFLCHLLLVYWWSATNETAAEYRERKESAMSNVSKKTDPSPRTRFNFLQSSKRQ